MRPSKASWRCGILLRSLPRARSANRSGLSSPLTHLRASHVGEVPCVAGHQGMRVRSLRAFQKNIVIGSERARTTARESMMTAATLAEMTFSNSSVALVHGMSRPIGAHFHVPHGLSNAMVLPSVTRFFCPGCSCPLCGLCPDHGAGVCRRS